eukprot:TRINITY_DN3032_c0_g1_i1.p1 TRINITY_DN3032_c0_g1~~TRINITY_DN3032_c0_g1_i1.p1  ORF type:complete len:395 (+),score=129.90 TRINITY_DN3032_c0_g1_i1:143-1327(+)
MPPRYLAEEDQDLLDQFGASDSEEEEEEELSDLGFVEEEPDLGITSIERGKQSSTYIEPKDVLSRDEEITLRYLNNIQLTPAKFSQLYHLPKFDEMIVGFYVKLLYENKQEMRNRNMDDRDVRRIPKLVRIGKIIDVEIKNIGYQLGNEEVNKYIWVEYMGSKRCIKLSLPSHDSFKQMELTKWKNDLKSQHFHIPTVGEVDELLVRFNELKDFKLSAKDIEKMVQDAGEVETSSRLLAKLKSLKEYLAEAKREGNINLVQSYTQQIKEIEAKINDPFSANQQEKASATDLARRAHAFYSKKKTHSDRSVQGNKKSLEQLKRQKKMEEELKYKELEKFSLMSEKDQSDEWFDVLTKFDLKKVPVSEPIFSTNAMTFIRTLADNDTNHTESEMEQ